MLDVINAGSGPNSATQDKFPRSILPGSFDYGFGTGLAYKGVRLCIDEAEQLGVPMVVGAAVRAMLAITNALYGLDSDYASICRVLEGWAGVVVCVQAEDEGRGFTVPSPRQDRFCRGRGEGSASSVRKAAGCVNSPPLNSLP